MVRKKAIPDEVRAQVAEIVREFNLNTVRNTNCFFSTRYRGRNLYLDRDDYGNIGPRCRLTYTGDMENWEFAIFLYSREKYDPDEWFFPGAENVDGTVEGALEAAMAAYP